MAKMDGEAWQIFAVMKDGQLQSVVAKDPNRPSVIDVTDDLAKHLHWVKTGGRAQTE